ncbi:MAG: ferritin family protein [Elusimicrobia bacterium]|nr:ferritin family protein [Elusimicrobiota bacterium]
MTKNATPKVFAFAIKMEQDGERFYRDLAAQSPDKGVQFILTGLADDEVKHAHILRELEKGASPTLTETSVLSGAKSVFSGMAARKAFAAVGTDQKALYLQALEIERRSRDFYKAQADGTALKPLRDVFLRLCDQENRHMFLLDNMIQFISRPQMWLENAEFNHLEEY